MRLFESGAINFFGIPLPLLIDGGMATSLEAKGVPSIAEASALVAAGHGARLLGTRVATSRATCAIAVGDGR